MPANPKETPETKTDSLENILEQFIATANRLVIRMEESNEEFKDEIRADTRELKEEMKSFKEEIRKFKEEIRTDTRKFKEGIRADTRKFKEEVMVDTRALKEEMKSFKDEIRTDTREFKQEMKDFKDNIRSDTRDMKRLMSRKWSELSDRMGTMIEDVVAPHMQTLMMRYFNDPRFDFFGIRIDKRNESNPDLRREFHVIAISDESFYIGEVIFSPTLKDVDRFAAVLPELGNYFPESVDKRVVPIFSGLHIRENVLKYLTQNGIYAMGLGKETMELLNSDDVLERKFT